MEEEGARRRAYNGPGGAGRFLQGLNEEDEDEDGDGDRLEDARRRLQMDADRARQTGAASQATAQKNRTRQRDNNPLNEGRAGIRDRNQNGAKAFELDMESATLLGRRHKKVGQAPGTGSPSHPLARDGNAPYEAPLSPMHIG